MITTSNTGPSIKESLRNIAFDSLSRFPIARWAPIPLRLIVGFGFMEHGFAKLSKGPDAFAAILHVAVGRAFVGGYFYCASALRV